VGHLARIVAALAGNKGRALNDFMLSEALREGSRDASMTDDEKQMEMLKKVFPEGPAVLGPDGKPAR
jgi:hypothetical protein